MVARLVRDEEFIELFKEIGSPQKIADRLLG
jgi:hypothetical protein